jgi:hypothetical protein
MRAFTVLTLCALGGPLAAEELGRGFVGHEIKALAGLGAPSGPSTEVGTATGTVDFEDDPAILEHAPLHCVGLLGTEPGMPCVFAALAEGGAALPPAPDEGAAGDQAKDDDGLDHLWTGVMCGPVAADPPDNLTCTVTVVDVTGAFEGVTRTALATVAPPRVRHPDGSASAHAVVSGVELVLAP